MHTPSTGIPVIRNTTAGERLFLNQLARHLDQKKALPGFGTKLLASLMAISTTQLNRKLVALTGHSTASLILCYRIYKAQQLLQDNKPVKLVAWQCGFPNAANFSRCFQKHCGCSPSQFRTLYALKMQPAFSWQIPLLDKDYRQLLQLAAQETWLAELLITILADPGAEQLNVEHLAACIHYSTSSLNRKMQQLLGIRPLQFIRDLRLQYAAELLAAGNISMSGVAYEAGFFDQAHFARCFRKVFGCAPSCFVNRENPQTSLSWLRKELMVQNEK